MSKIINGAYKCPRCGGAKWKMEESGIIYCINEVEGHYCCWHLSSKQVKKIKEAVKREDERRNFIIAKIRRKYSALDERF
jgi:uncharacterized protein CbrC (UPF0167 family)